MKTGLIDGCAVRGCSNQSSHPLKFDLDGIEDLPVRLELCSWHYELLNNRRGNTEL